MSQHELPDISNGGETRSFPPELFSKEIVEQRIGDVVVGYTAWGTPIDVTSAGAGFATGYHYPPDYDIASDEAQARQVAQAAAMIEKGLKTRGWDGVDIVIVGSTSSRDTIAQEAADRLRSKGISVDTILFYGQACQDGLGPIMDMCRNDQFHYLRVAVAVIETLSGNVLNPSADEKPTFMRNLFGNGGAYFIFTPGKDITHIFGRSVVIEDKQGVIRLPSLYTLPPEEEHLPTLVGYEFQDGSEHIYARTESGSYLQMPVPRGQYAELDGQGTLFLFATNGGLIIHQGNKRYQEKFQSEHGPLGEPWMHQPSKPVIDAVEKVHRQYLLADLGFERGELRRILKLDRNARSQFLQERGIEFTDPQYPWVGPEMGINNTAGVCALAQLAVMIQQNRIKPGVVAPVYGLAVGAMISTDYIIFNRS